MEIDFTNKYWLGIYPEVYYVKKSERGLLYNTQNGNYMHLKTYEVLKFIDKMHEKQNLGVIDLEVSTLVNENIRLFIQGAIDKKICFLVDKSSQPFKPVQMMPILNLQLDVDKLNNDQWRSVGENILEYLSDITLILTNNCKQNCSQCENYYKQFSHCRSNGKSKDMDFVLLKMIIEQTYNRNYSRILITGGNIFEYHYFNELFEYCSSRNYYPTLSFHYKNLPLDLNHILTQYPLRIYISDFEFKEAIFNDALLGLNAIGQTEFIFVISTLKEFETISQFINTSNIQKFNIFPFYNTSNKMFFENNIYLSENDILSSGLKHQNIFANQKLNSNFFGNIEIRPDGEVFSHPLFDKIGNINQTSLAEIIENEMTVGQTWRKIRNENPCTDCLYQFLCPSPSTYEKIIGKPNLCTVNFK